MDLNDYGPFAPVVAIAATLVAVFGVLLLKAVGRVSQWTWLIEDTPPFLATAGARAVTVALIGLTFVLIDKGNYLVFAGLAVLSGLVALFLINRFDRLRRTHICRVPIVAADGSQATDRRSRPLFRAIVIGLAKEMKPSAKAAYDQLVGVSPCQFLSGFGATQLNDPAAIWEQDVLARTASRLTMTLMAILLTAVMALYWTAAAVEVHQRPLASPPATASVAPR